MPELLRSSGARRTIVSRIAIPGICTVYDAGESDASVHRHAVRRRERSTPES